MIIIHFIITVLLFVLLTPGILLRLPPKSTALISAIVHAVLFSVVLFFVNKYILPIFTRLEGFKEESGLESHTISPHTISPYTISPNKPNTLFSWFKNEQQTISPNKQNNLFEWLFR